MKLPWMLLWPMMAAAGMAAEPLLFDREAVTQAAMNAVRAKYPDLDAGQLAVRMVDCQYNADPSVTYTTEQITVEFWRPDSLRVSTNQDERTFTFEIVTAHLRPSGQAWQVEDVRPSTTTRAENWSMHGDRATYPRIIQPRKPLASWDDVMWLNYRSDADWLIQKLADLTGEEFVIPAALDTPIRFKRDKPVTLAEAISILQEELEKHGIQLIPINDHANRVVKREDGE